MISRVSVISPLNADEENQIILFKERAEDLFNSLKRHKNIPIASYSQNPSISAFSFKANTPDNDAIAILAMKFRFFFADKEPTQFEKIINMIRNKTQDEWARNYIDHIKIWYKQSMKSTNITANLGHPTTNREILSLWFNSKLFHSDVEKREKLESLHRKIGEDPSSFQFYLAIVKGSSEIKKLYDVVHRLDRSSKKICTPNHHFRLNKTLKPTAIKRSGLA